MPWIQISRFVRAPIDGITNLFYRELINSSDRNHGQNKARLKYMQWFAELWVFWFEFSSTPLLSIRGQRQWAINQNDLISHVCLVWYSDGQWLSLEQDGISEKIRAEPPQILLECMDSPQTLRCGLWKC